MLDDHRAGIHSLALEAFSSDFRTIGQQHEYTGLNKMHPFAATVSTAQSSSKDANGDAARAAEVRRLNNTCSLDGSELLLM
jgi:hypothetical protein